MNNLFLSGSFKLKRLRFLIQKTVKREFSHQDHPYQVYELAPDPSFALAVHKATSQEVSTGVANLDATQ